MISESGKPANKKIKIDYSALKEEEKSKPTPAKKSLNISLIDKNKPSLIYAKPSRESIVLGAKKSVSKEGKEASVNYSQDLSKEHPTKSISGEYVSSKGMSIGGKYDTDKRMSATYGSKKGSETSVYYSPKEKEASASYESPKGKFYEVDIDLKNKRFGAEYSNPKGFNIRAEKSPEESRIEAGYRTSKGSMIRGGYSTGEEGKNINLSYQSKSGNRVSGKYNTNVGRGEFGAIINIKKKKKS